MNEFNREPQSTVNSYCKNLKVLTAAVTNNIFYHDIISLISQIVWLTNRVVAELPIQIVLSS